MYIGNFILLLLNLPFVPLFANILRVPKKVLLPLVMLFCVTGMYSVNNSVLDIWMMLRFGGLGYLLRKAGLTRARPLLLAWSSARSWRSLSAKRLMISHGDFGIFVERPVSLAFLVATGIFLVSRSFGLGLGSWGKEGRAAANGGQLHLKHAGIPKERRSSCETLSAMSSWSAHRALGRGPRGRRVPDQGSPDHRSLGGRWCDRPYFPGPGRHRGQVPQKAVVVVNRPGGGGAVGFTEAMKARPDGYTLTTAVTPLCILPHQTTTAFTYQDFDPILNVVSDPSMFLVRADAPWKTCASSWNTPRRTRT